MAISRHQVNTGSASTTTTVSTTLPVNSGEIVVVQVTQEATSGAVLTVTGVSDGVNSYAKRFSASASGANEPAFAASEGTEVWWALATTTTTLTITATLSGTFDDAVILAAGYQGFTGTAYQTNPWDSNASLPKTNQAATSGAATASGISTTSTAGMLIAAHASCDNGALPSPPPTGFGLAAALANTGAVNAIQGSLWDEVYSSAQSSITVTVGSATNGWIFYVDALTDSAAAAASPIVNVNTSAPLVLPPPLSFRTWTSKYNQNLIGQDILPAGRKGITFDLAPRAYLPPGKTWTWQYNVNLIGQDAFPPGLRGLTFDLAPKGPKPAGPTWTWAYNQNLIGQDVFPPGRKGITVEKAFRLDWRRGWEQNLLLTTLSIVIQSPFNQYDWPLPQRAVQPDRTWVSSAATLQLMLPPPGDDWTDLPPAPQSWRRDWTQNLVLSTLTGQDAFPPGQSRYDRPQPTAWSQSWTQNLLLSTLAQTTGIPFNQFDWPLPVRATQPDRTQTGSFNLNLIGQDVFPPGQQRFETPPPVSWRRDWAQNLVLSVLVGQDRFPPGQQRFETPLAVSWRRDWTQNLVLSTLVAQDQLPPGQVSNRVIVPDPWRKDWSQNLLLSTLAPVIQAPFNQFDWPLPVRSAPVGQTWTSNLLLSTLAQTAQAPFNQFDWPLSRNWVQPDRTFIQSRNLNLDGQDQLPVRQMDWPVPQRAIQPDRSLAASFNLNLIAQDQLPFRQTDWPVPVGYYYPLSVRSVAPLNPNLFPPSPPPAVTELHNNPFFAHIGRFMGS